MNEYDSDGSAVTTVDAGRPVTRPVPQGIEENNIVVYRTFS